MSALFTAEQLRMLGTQPPKNLVRPIQRDAGLTVYYLDGWYCIEVANRIFGIGNWAYETVSNQKEWGPVLKEKPDRHGVLKRTVLAQFRAIVRVTVHSDDGSRSVSRTGSGAQQGEASAVGDAMSIAFKGAETDALKRALATFGPAFGLDLKNKDRARAVGEGMAPDRTPRPSAEPVRTALARPTERPLDVGFGGSSNRDAVNKDAVEMDITRRVDVARQPLPAPANRRAPVLAGDVDGCPV